MDTDHVSVVQTTIKYSPLWRHFVKIRLTKNMRTGDGKEFVKWLLELGEGRVETHDEIRADTITISPQFFTEKSLMNEVYGKKLKATQAS